MAKELPPDVTTGELEGCFDPDMNDAVYRVLEGADSIDDKYHNILLIIQEHFIANKNG